MAAPLVDKRVLLGKEMVEAYEAIQEFVVAEQDSRIVGFGALHVMWQDLAEVRTLVVEDQSKRQGIGKALLAELEARAQALGVERVFCLTFEKEFFETNGYQVISDVPVDPATYAELVRSHDNGVAEFLDLARVKQNTLGNSRMLKQL
jgi:amino-acid N-acetyltransferase